MFPDVILTSPPLPFPTHPVFYRPRVQALHDFVDKRSDGNVGEALVSFLLWVSKYDRLFQDPCKIANKLVAVDSGTGEPLPPTLRTPDGTALMPESLAGTIQREPQRALSPVAAVAAAAAAAAAAAVASAQT